MRIPKEKRQRQTERYCLRLANTTTITYTWYTGIAATVVPKSWVGFGGRACSVNRVHSNLLKYVRAA